MAKIDLDAIRQGDRLALARALTAVENDRPSSRSILAALFPHTGNAHLVGVTGATGTGKSTLVNQLAKSFRSASHNAKRPKIAIIAVDPTSPFTGGALLGDRIRMQDLAGDKGIFIRSMASRGAFGGLAHKTAAFVTVLDGAGFDLILIETVGAGQAEVDIARLAHTVIVVDAPGLGDDIQAIKAGILEIADILVVNKADRPGAENTSRALQVMLAMAQGKPGRQATGKHMRKTMPTTSKPVEDDPSSWQPPVLLTTATEGKGIEDLIVKIHDHKNYLKESGLWQEKEADRLQKDLEALVQDALWQQWQQDLDKAKFEAVLADVIQRKRTPLEAMDMLLKRS